MCTITIAIQILTVIFLFMSSYRIVESFEVISTQYVQQLPPNTQVSFVTPSVTVIGENVSMQHNI